MHRCAANLQVRADVGRVALQKGPFVYCFEQQDNGENLAALRMAPDAAVEEKAPAEGLPVICGAGCERLPDRVDRCGRR